ncbi:MAG: chorismate synthase, partial [Rhodospirillales bacterium]|nr:chorismate synthase [Rhodospirillales bacterium]
MSGNSFGHLFKFTTFGESHGPAIGVVVDGVPPNIHLTEEDIQLCLDRRKPGQSRFTTQRREADQIEILSGVFEGATTGAPVGLLIRNTDARSKDYDDIKDLFRPGHADWTYFMKYGNRDYRGSGRASARETACRVAAGAIARKILGPTIEVRGALIQIGPHAINRNNWDWDQVGENPFWSPDAESVAAWETYMDQLRKNGSSAGAKIEIMARGVPVGLGAPLYDKLDSDIAAGLMSINAVKGVEIGDGMATAAFTGQENADEMRITDGQPAFTSNHAGGILGGISSGQDIIARFAVKPTSSINTPRKTITTDNEETEVITKGRHDPCVGIRAVPVGEAMVACILADHYLRHRAMG